MVFCSNDHTPSRDPRGTCSHPASTQTGRGPPVCLPPISTFTSILESHCSKELSEAWRGNEMQGLWTKYKRFGLLIIVLLFIFLFRAVPAHMEIPRRGVESELQLMAYTTATATPDPSCLCDLRRSSWQRRILYPLSKARDPTGILTDTSWIHSSLSHNRNS